MSPADDETLHDHDPHRAQHGYGGNALTTDLAKDGRPATHARGLASQVWGWSRESVEAHHTEELNLDLGDRRLVITLAPMGEGAEVVEDYRAGGLSLRAHPLVFLRNELKARRMISCADLRSAKDGRWIELAGIVLVRQKPGSAKGVMFITLEGETDVANLVVWTNVFEKNRRTVLGAPMMGVRGRVQREGEVIHVIAERLDDLSALLASVGQRGEVSDLYRVSRADVVKHGMGPDLRDPAARPLGKAARTIYIPDLRLGSGIIPGQPTEGIKIKPRDFR